MRSLCRLILSMTLAGCASPAGSSATMGSSELALFNGLDSEDVVVVSLDGTRLALPVSGGRSVITIESGAHHLEVRQPSGLLSSRSDFKATAAATLSAIIARTGAARVAALIARDTAVVPPATAIKLRVVHAADDTEAMQAWVRLNGEPRTEAALLAPAFASGYGSDSGFTGYALRSPGFHVVTATSLNPAEVLVEGGKHLAGGHIWIAILVRSVTGALEFRLFRDR